MRIQIVAVRVTDQDRALNFYTEKLGFVVTEDLDLGAGGMRWLSVPPPGQYAAPMDSISAGELVKVASGGPELDGIVFDTPSSSKIVVAVVDAARGPVFRTVHPSTLSEREEEVPADQLLRQLIRRTP